MIPSKRFLEKAHQAKRMSNRFTFDMGPIRGKRMRRLKKWLAVYNKLVRRLCKR